MHRPVESDSLDAQTLWTSQDLGWAVAEFEAVQSFCLLHLCDFMPLCLESPTLLSIDACSDCLPALPHISALVGYSVL